MTELSRYDSVPVEKLRDKVMDDLVRHYSLERLSLEEFERRSTLVTRADSRGDLLMQVSDLPALPEEAKPARREAARGKSGWSIAKGSVRANDASVAIFGGSDFKGVWRAPRRLTSLCVFGGANIDLRKAIVPEEGITISCICAFGGADIIVPPGMRLLVRGMALFGGFDRTSNEPDDPDAPTVVVEGIAVFGGVSVRIRE